MTSDEALAALDADVDRILEKRRYLLGDQAHDRARARNRGVPQAATSRDFAYVYESPRGYEDDNQRELEGSW
jgi:hypothetical protein